MTATVSVHKNVAVVVMRLQVGAPLLKQALILNRRFRGKHSELELAILAADNMIC